MIVQVMPAIECMTTTGAQFSDGQMDDFDAVILATGYRSNVPRWLKVVHSIPPQYSDTFKNKYFF